MTEQVFEGWCILELMGHRKLAGYVRPQEIAGQGFLRIDVSGTKNEVVTQFYSPQAVYAITPTSEALAKAFADGLNVQPVTRWELPASTQVPDAPDTTCRLCGHEEGEHTVSGSCVHLHCICPEFKPVEVPAAMVAEDLD